MCGRVVDQATTRRGPARTSHPDTQDPSELLLSWSDVEERGIRIYEVGLSRDATAASWSRANQCDDGAVLISTPLLLLLPHMSGVSLGGRIESAHMF